MTPTGSTAFALDLKAKDAEIERLKGLIRTLVAITDAGVPVTSDFMDDLRKAAQ